MQYFCNFLGITGLDQKNDRKPIYFTLLTSFAVFFCSLSVCYFAQGEQGRDNPGQIIQKSISNVRDKTTIECNLRMAVWVDSVEFMARGRYEEQVSRLAAKGDFLRSMYRLDINFLSDVPLAPGSDPNRMTVVCHLSEDRAKSQIWQYMSIEEKKELRIIRIPTLENAIKKSRREPYFTSISEVFNLGGLAGTLRQIDRFYEFTDPPESVTLDGGETVNVWKLKGKIREECYEMLLEQFGETGEKKIQPSDFPSDIELCIGKEDLFPYVIKYYNRSKKKTKKLTPLSEVSYFNVILNGEEIDVGNFALFNENGEYPEGVFTFQDDTAWVIQSLGL